MHLFYLQTRKMLLRLVFVLTGLALATAADVIKAYSDVDYQVNGAQHLRWSVEVYDYSNGEPQHKCGGSLVTPTVVISAARCFWAKGEQMPASQFEVARTFGGLTVGTVWQAVQKTKVRMIHLPPSYRDRAGLYADDIAVLTLAKPLPGATPICVSFDEDLETQQLTEGNFGRNMGTLQLAGNGLPSPLFTALEVPSVSPARCANGSEPYYREQLTGDKICTGFKPGVSDRPESLLCRGDHGSGLAFYSGTEYSAIPYLRGVASTPFPDPSEPYGTYISCSTFRYAAFTRISSHRAFLEHHIPDIEAKCAQYYRVRSSNFECNCRCNNNNETST